MKQLRKSKKKPRSQRSIEMEQQANEIIERERQKALKKKKSNSRMLVMMLCMYSLSAAVLSWLFDYLGIVAVIAIVLGVAGLCLHGTEKKDRELYMAYAGLGLGILREIVFAYQAIAFYMQMHN